VTGRGASVVVVEPLFETGATGTVVDVVVVVEGNVVVVAGNVVVVVDANVVVVAGGASEVPDTVAEPGAKPLLVAVTVTVADVAPESPVTVNGRVAPTAVPHVAVPALTVGAVAQ
jgi:hypothetical protein